MTTKQKYYWTTPAPEEPAPTKQEPLKAVTPFPQLLGIQPPKEIPPATQAVSDMWAGKTTPLAPEPEKIRAEGARTLLTDEQGIIALRLFPTDIGIDASIEKQLFSPMHFKTTEEVAQYYETRGEEMPPDYYIRTIKDGGIYPIQVLTPRTDMEIPELTFGVDDATGDIHVLFGGKTVGAVDKETEKLTLDDAFVVRAQQMYSAAYGKTLAPSDASGVGIFARINQFLDTPRVVGEEVSQTPREELGTIALVALVVGTIYEGFPAIRSLVSSATKRVLDVFVRKNAWDIASLAQRGEAGQFSTKNRLLYRIYSYHGHYITTRAQEVLKQRSAAAATARAAGAPPPQPILQLESGIRTSTQTTEKILQTARTGKELTTASVNALAVRATPPDFLQGINAVISGQIVTAGLGAVTGVPTTIPEVATIAAAEWGTTTGVAGVEFQPIPTDVGQGYEILQYGNAVGKISYSDTSAFGVDGMMIGRIDIEESARRQGLATQAIEKVLSEAESRGVPLYTGLLEPDGVQLFNALESQGAIQLTPAPERMLGEVVTRGVPEYAPTTAMAEGETFTGEITPEPIDLVISKLTNAIRTAGPARVETELLKTAELGRRVPKMREAALAAKAEEAGFAAMGQLKGGLPKAQFTPPETTLLLRERAALFEYLRNNLLVERGDAFKWLHTDAALRKILGGEIPTQSELVLLEDAFGPDLVEAILSKRPLSQKIWENFLDVINIPRVLQTMNDLSAFFRQGAFIATAHPKIGARALVVDVKSFFSGKYSAEIDQWIRSHEYFEKLKKDGVYFAPLGEGKAAKLSEREEMFMSRLIKRIPGLGHLAKFSERAYINTLNYMRLMTAAKVRATLEKGDYPVSAYKQNATLVNWATGRGPIGKLANMTPLLNAIIYAIRLQTSRWGMLFGAFKFTSPPVRKEYIRMMLSFFGTVGGIVALGDLAGLWTTEKDPRSSDFGKIRIGNTRLDPWAGFQPIIRLIAQIITAERVTATGRVQDISRMETLERFLRSKASPVFGLAWDIVEGETFIGEALSLDTEGIREQSYQRLVSLFIQDMIDAIKEDGWIGGVAALPGILGVGVVTYPGSLDAYERHIAEIPDDMLLDWQRGVQGSKGELNYKNLNVLQKAWLRRHCEEIGDTPERKEAGTYNFYEAQGETYEEFEVLLNEEVQDVATAFQAGEISLSDYIEQSEYTRNKYFGQASRLWLDAMREKLDPLLHKNLERWHEEEIKPEDVAYEEYMTLRANPPKVSGVPDWDAWDKALSEFLDGQTEESRNYIEQRRIDWINNLPEDRQPIERLVLDCESILDDYYAIESDKRMAYRDRHPEVDARLIILRGLKPRSGARVARVLLQKYGIAEATKDPYLWTTPPEEPTEPQQWGTPEEPPAEPTEPKYKWTP